MSNANLKSITKRTLATVGLDIRRTRPQAQAGYYPVVETCQIPYLSFIYELFFGQVNDGCFVEVGGYDGITYSNTWGLAEMGWNGLLVEPVPALAKLARENHNTHPGVSVIEAAAGSSADKITLHLGGPFTTADSTQAKEYEKSQWAAQWMTNETITVNQFTLDSLLERAQVKPGFDVLVVDVEGHEASVFEGFTIDRWKPKMMIIELEDVHPSFVTNRQAHAVLTRKLISHGYRIISKDFINTIFVAEEIVHTSLELD